MKPNTPEAVRRANVRALVAALVIAALCLACLSLPVYRFSATVFSKKSGNTFVGDEKYLLAKAEVEAEANARAEATGVMPEIVETVTERVNSKGNKTSMVAFEVREVMRRTGWQFIASGLAGGYVLLAMIACVALALMLLFVGLRGAMDVDWPALAQGKSAPRRAAAALALVALMLVPVFMMYNKIGRAHV